MTTAGDGETEKTARRGTPTTVGEQAADCDDAGDGSWISGLLMFERHGDTFVAPQPTSDRQRLFGGLVAAQALGAASATVAPDKLPQSLHAYFIRPGGPGVDVVFEVERTRDGGSFDTRRVTATQDGKAILEMLASFHVAETGADDHPEGPQITGPDEARTMKLPASDMGELFEFRSPEDGEFGPPYWIRSRTPVERDPVLRAAALTYMSDFGLMVAARPPGTLLDFESGMAATSLDHAIWFHRPFDPAAWHVYQATRLNNNDARGLALGGYYDTDGVLVATTMQEALWRV